MSKLKFPSHFPPTDPWKKFFIGVRWLGPDLSFFARLKRKQGERQPSCMSAWVGPGKEVAEAIGVVLSRSLGWRSPYFLPEDMVEVAFHGPSFDFTDPEAAFNLDTLGEVVHDPLAVTFLEAVLPPVGVFLGLGEHGVDQPGQFVGCSFFPSSPCRWSSWCQLAL